MTNRKKTVVAVLSDLMFRVKIAEAAKRAGMEAVFVTSQQEALLEARRKPAIMILDLNHSAMEPLDTISKLKSDGETNSIKLLGYVSHVQAELKRAAQAQGCDMVIARSAFSQNLPTILSRYTGGA